MDNAKVIAKLNDILRHEWTGVAQYAQHSFMVQDLWREVFAKLFREGAEESFGHAQKIGDKIVALGGVPTVDRNEVRQSTDLHEMLRYALDFERTAVKLYAEALALVGDDDVPLRVLLEDIILEEQEGVDHLQKLLAQPRAAAAKDKREGKVG
jgi:bacterioferritin